uniref:ATP synthase complex subunit 8 n=1 Tax=Theopropus elegans TaxID=444635 RepID=A0A343UMV9_9NEOP|nr:ATP synthase F0 subunit 8 [Theopropus elegans]
MPQMMPLNWLMLFLFFSITLLLFNMMNFYTPYNKKTSPPLMKMKFKSMSWKW